MEDNPSGKKPNQNDSSDIGDPDRPTRPPEEQDVTLSDQSPSTFGSSIEPTFSDSSGETTEGQSDYALVLEIGSGGMGKVYLAHDSRLNRWVALKRLSDECRNDPQLYKRFQVEAKAVASLSHYHIVQVFAFSEDDQGPYIAMEYVPGPPGEKEFTHRPSLQDKKPPSPSLTLHEKILKSGPFSEESTVRLGIKLCSALAYAHKQGVIHRDVKPSNILLNEDFEPKLTDFGLARQLDPNGFQMTLPGTQFLTLDYCAPEQERDIVNVDHRADIYSLGATLWFSLTGQSPRFFRESEVPETLRPIFNKAMAHDQKNRFSSADEFGNALQTSLNSTHLQNKSPSRDAESPLDNSNQWECVSCGQSNQNELRYCLNCGQKKPSYCPNCKMSITEDVRFCQYCGTVIKTFINPRETKQKTKKPPSSKTPLKPLIVEYLPDKLPPAIASSKNLLLAIFLGVPLLAASTDGLGWSLYHSMFANNGTDYLFQVSALSTVLYILIICLFAWTIYLSRSRTAPPSSETNGFVAKMSSNHPRITASISLLLLPVLFYCSFPIYYAESSESFSSKIINYSLYAITILECTPFILIICLCFFKAPGNLYRRILQKLEYTVSSNASDGNEPNGSSRINHENQTGLRLNLLPFLVLIAACSIKLTTLSFLKLRLVISHHHSYGDTYINFDQSIALDILQLIFIIGLGVGLWMWILTSKEGVAFLFNKSPKPDLSGFYQGFKRARTSLIIFLLTYGLWSLSCYYSRPIRLNALFTLFITSGYGLTLSILAVRRLTKPKALDGLFMAKLGIVLNAILLFIALLSATIN